MSRQSPKLIDALIAFRIAEVKKVNAGRAMLEPGGSRDEIIALCKENQKAIDELDEAARRLGYLYALTSPLRSIGGCRAVSVAVSRELIRQRMEG